MRRSPHGERGLKFPAGLVAVLPRVSLPSRGAWIEIPNRREPGNPGPGSLPSRGAWIEIPHLVDTPEGFLVAPLTGSVD